MPSPTWRWFRWATGNGGPLAFAQPAPDAAQSTFTSSAFANTADGATSTTLTFTAKNATGAVMPNVPVTWSVSRITLDAAESFVGVNPGDIDSDGVDSAVITSTIAKIIDDVYVGMRGIPAANVVQAVSGTGNTLTQPSVATNAAGVTTGLIKSTQASASKTVSQTVLGLAMTQTATLTTDSGVTPIFSDGFETGDLTYTANGVAWKTPDGTDAIAGTGANGSFTRTSGTWSPSDQTGRIVYFQTTSGNVQGGDVNLLGPFTVTSNTTTILYFTGDATGAVQTRTHRPFVTSSFARGASTYSVKFIFGPDLADADTRAQLGFNLPISGFGELWLEYYLHVPAGYEHRDAPGTDNNKFAGIFGRDRVADASRMLFDFEVVPDGSLGSSMFAQSVYSDGLIGSGAQSVAGDTGYEGTSFIPTPVTLNAWNRFRIHLKSETASGAADGVMQLWVENTKVFEATGRKFGYPFATGSAWYGTFPALVDNGYLLGAANSGHAALTVFHLDDVKFYSSDPSWTF